MSGRSPARLLAPIALVLFAVAFLAVLSSGGGGGGEREQEAASPAASAQPTTTTKKPTQRESSSSARSYTVKPGDTPSSIAEDAGVSLQRLLELNPEIDPNTLRPGDKLKLGP